MNYALILAGGVGSRMGADVPKQFIEVGGKPIIIHSLERFAAHSDIDSIFVVCIEEWQPLLEKQIAEFGLSKVTKILPQGRDRRESSYIGIKAIAEDAEIRGASLKDSVVLIHDAARPLVTAEIISENIADAKRYGACETVCKMADTVIKSEDGFTRAITDIVPRESLFRVQTPQSFTLDVILSAHENYIKILAECEQLGDNAPEITDDAGLVLLLGKEVKLTDGSSLNIKLTTREDIDFFAAVTLKNNEK